MKRLICGFGLSLFCAASLCGADWPQWRGPDRGNRVTDFIPPATWPTAPVAAETNTVSPSLGLQIWVRPYQAVKPGMPSTPR